ncbi:MAG: NUDIX domain-containing protein [Anaerolineaceae bacterium]
MDQSGAGSGGPVHRHGGCSSPAKSKNVDRKFASYCPDCGTKTVSRLEFGKMRPTCPNCGWISFQDPKVATAVLIEIDGKVLLTRRVNEPGQGLWTLPAGYIDAGEDPMAAAVRECLEETGMVVRITGLLDVLGGKEHPRGADILILYSAEIIGGELTAGDDADAVGYFSRTELPELAFKSTRIALELESGNFFRPRN